MKRKHLRVRTTLYIGLLMTVLLTACDLNFTSDNNPVSDGTHVYELLRWRDPDEAIDVIFAPDDDYGDLSNDANRQTFLNDVADLIDSGFWQNNALASNIGAVNFWFSTVAGDVQPNSGSGICPSVTWPNTTQDDFAEVLVLLHPNDLRDCRWGSRVTSEPYSYRTVVHEFSHAAFNLRDEYCCDGGYGELPPVMYSSANACNNDAANAAWRDCEQLEKNGDTAPWWRSQGTNNDIMRNAGSTVWEVGPGGWVVMENVMDALPSYNAQTPDVFAPDAWDWP